MTRIASLAATAALIGDPARTAILVALMDGRALTAGELARAAGVAPPTASGHLGKLVDGGLLSVVSQGRHRYFRLASPEVAAMIEGMMAAAGFVEAARTQRPIATGPRDRALRRARVCYDHLAGAVAVAIADSLVDAGDISLNEDGAALTASGITRLTDFGLDLQAGGEARAFCRPCLDWSERRPHLAGRTGRLLLAQMIERRWLRRSEGRTVEVTPAGVAGLREQFGFSLTGS